MKIIELEKSKRLKISFEKISELTLSEYKSSEVLIASNNSALNSERSFVLELVLPTNSSYYAALGAKYIPSEGYNNLIIEVRYTENYVENYSTSFAYDEKTVFKGLPKEYVETLLKTAANYLQADGIGIPCGKIVFDSAAYCEVGSSPLMFRIATKIVLDALLSKGYPGSDSDITNICEKHLLERI